MLRLLLLCGALGCGAEQAAPLTLTMVHYTRVFEGNSLFWGNASLDGRLSHVLEGHSVTQVLPLEPPDAWAQRQKDVSTYLIYFSNLVKLFNKERPMDFPHFCTCPLGSPVPPQRPWCDIPHALVSPCPLGASIQDNNTQRLCCRLGCRLFPNGTSHSFYEVTLNGTAFLSFHVPNATWQRRWPGQHQVAAFAETELMKYPITTHDLQHFLNTTCVSILQAQSARTGKLRGRSRAPLVLGLILGALCLLGMAVGIFWCTGGSC